MSSRFSFGGDGGPVTLVPARVAARLARYIDFDRLRLELRGEDADTDGVLLGLKAGSAGWRAQLLRTDSSTDVGTSVDEMRTDDGLSSHASRADLLTTAAVAGIVDITPRGVLKAVERGRLRAVAEVGGRYVFDPGEVAAWAASRRHE